MWGRTGFAMLNSLDLHFAVSLKVHYVVFWEGILIRSYIICRFILGTNKLLFFFFSWLDTLNKRTDLKGQRDFIPFCLFSSFPASNAVLGTLFTSENSSSTRLWRKQFRDCNITSQMYASSEILGAKFIPETTSVQSSALIPPGISPCGVNLWRAVEGGGKRTVGFSWNKRKTAMREQGALGRGNREKREREENTVRYTQEREREGRKRWRKWDHGAVCSRDGEGRERGSERRHFDLHI